MEESVPIHLINRVIAHKLAFVNAVDARDEKFEEAVNNMTEGMISADFTGEGAMYPGGKSHGRDTLTKIIKGVRAPCSGISHDLHRPTVSVTKEGDLLTSTLSLEMTRIEKDPATLATEGFMIRATDTWRVGKDFGSTLVLESTKNEVIGKVNPSKSEDVVAEVRRNRLLAWLTMW